MWKRITAWIQKTLLPKTEFDQQRMIFRTRESHLAHLFKLKLEEEGMKVVMINKMDSSYLNFGEIELYVDAKDVVRAKFIIDKPNE